MATGAGISEIAEAVEVQADDLHDFDRVVCKYRRGVFRYLLASLGDWDDAETLTQDCFLKAFRCRDQFRGDAAVRTWLLRIAANLVRDRLRSRRFQFWRRARSASVCPEDLVARTASHEISPEAGAVSRELVETIWTATGRLPQGQRVVFLLRFVEDLTLAEIAQVLGTTEGTVKKQLFRALANVRKEVRTTS